MKYVKEKEKDREKRNGQIENRTFFDVSAVYIYI